VITWTVVPDGTDIPDRNGNPADSNLRAFLNGIYGNESVWLPIIESVFERWEALTGVDYQYEPADDGSYVLDTFGSAGVRADVRIGGLFIDGPGNVLAYNTGDTFYNILDSNSIRLRNVVAHEHGHGAGHFHVCPINATKLMEPTVAVPYDGPRADDIRGMHRQYGDVNEPDDTLATGKSLGTLAPGQSVTRGPTPAPVVPFASVLSIDAATEQDFHLVTLSGAARLAVTLTPVGNFYDNAVQNSGACPTGVAGCCTRSFSDSLRALNLDFEVLSSSGGVLSTAALAGAGDPESASITLAAGDYAIRVFASGGGDDVQFYNLSLSATGGTTVLLAPESSAPAAIPFNTPTNLVFIVDQGNDTLVGGPRLFVRTASSGAFTSTAMTNLGGGRWQGTIEPVLCETQYYYARVEGILTGEVLFPASGAAAPLSVGVGTPVNFRNFSFGAAGDEGWTVSNGAGLTDGAWQRAQPGLAYCGLGDPYGDFDGSGWCFVTDADQPGAGSACNNDVDNGDTTLTSPVISLSGLIEPQLEYARWFNNGITSSLPNDPLVVEVSSNGGGSWTPLEQVGPTPTTNPPETAGEWYVRRFALAPVVGSTSNFRVRFRASDFAPGSRVEAAIDSVRVFSFSCSAVPVPCPGDADGSSTVTFLDITTILANFGNVYTPGSGAGDTDSNGIVNFLDLTTTLANFGNTCS
jgi:hypothetical protein